MQNLIFPLTSTMPTLLWRKVPKNESEVRMIVGKRRKSKRMKKNRKAAGLTAQAKKDKKVLIKYFTARNRTRNVRGT